MSTGENRSDETFDWYVGPDQGGGEFRAAYVARMRQSVRRTNSLALAITMSMLFVLVSAAVMVGGRVAVAPLLRQAAAAREAQGVGEVVYAMPDGVFCRHMAFDNATANVTENAVERCPNPPAAVRAGAAKFEWGRR